MGKAIHSIIAATEVLYALRTYIGERPERRVHPETAELIAKTQASIDSVLQLPLIEDVCLPSSLELIRDCRELMEVY